MDQSNIAENNPILHIVKCCLKTFKYFRVRVNTLTPPSPLLHFSLKAFFWLSFVATFVFCAPFFTADDPLPPIPSEVATVATQVSESGTSGELVTPEASALQPEVRILKEERKRLLGFY